MWAVRCFAAKVSSGPLRAPRLAPRSSTPDLCQTPSSAPQATVSPLMAKCRVPRPLPVIAALVSSCAGSPKQHEEPSPVTPCQFWKVTVQNEFSFPVSVHLYAARRRTSLGAAPPGTSSQWSSDSGQVTFTAPLGMSLIARGKQIRGLVTCAQRTPA